MQKLIVILYKIFKRIILFVRRPIEHGSTAFLFYCNTVKRASFKTSGVPFVSVVKGGHFSIGNNFKMNNSGAANPIGRIQKCSFFVEKNGILTIGNSVGISFTAIYCSRQITIHDNVMIGGGTCIYDTDFHPLSAADRLTDKDEKTASAPVVIESNAFVGANCTVLKGVTIGSNSIVGACSVVTKSIPPNEIWGGNPAKFIKAQTPVLHR
jgi:acetyltransferase-like isoleucine patch superfamily enzyme